MNERCSGMWSIAKACSTKIKSPCGATCGKVVCILCPPRYSRYIHGQISPIHICLLSGKSRSIMTNYHAPGTWKGTKPGGSCAKRVHSKVVSVLSVYQDLGEVIIWLRLEHWTFPVSYLTLTRVDTSNIQVLTGTSCSVILPVGPKLRVPWDVHPVWHGSPVSQELHICTGGATWDHPRVRDTHRRNESIQALKAQMSHSSGFGSILRMSGWRVADGTFWHTRNSRGEREQCGKSWIEEARRKSVERLIDEDAVFLPSSGDPMFVSESSLLGVSPRSYS